MDHDESKHVFSELPDVTSARLSALLRKDDLALNEAIRDLVATLREPTEVTLGWNNMYHRTTSVKPSSTS